MDPPPPLYRADRKGGVREWRTWVECEGEAYFLCSESGLRKTADARPEKPRRARKEIKGNSRSGARERALHAMRKQWQDRIDKECFSIAMPATDAKGAAVARLEEDDRGIVEVRPMLAKPVELTDKDVKGMPWPLLAQAKIDGFRCVIHLYGEAGKEGHMTTRTGAVYKGFKTFRQTIVDHIPPELLVGKRLCLDGELYVTGASSFSEISSILKRGQNRPDFSHPDVCLKVFDCFDLDALEQPFVARYNVACAACAQVPGVTVLDVQTLTSMGELEALHTQYVAEGHEGVMVRTLNGPYKLRGRSGDLRKYKHMKDAEYRIVGFKEGQGDAAGAVVWVCATADGQEFRVTPAAPLSHRRTLFQEGEAHVGAWLTVQYQELSEKGVPRFPIGKAIRDGNDHEECGPPAKKSHVA